MSNTMAPNETSYMTSYMWIMVINPLSCTFTRCRPKQCYRGGQKTNMEIEQKLKGHTCWPSQAFSLYQVWKKSSCCCCSSYSSKCVYIQDGRHAAILNYIKNLFDVYNLQPIPHLGVKFQSSGGIGVAQLVAGSTPHRCVVGSSPTRGTEHFSFPPTALRLGNQRPWYVQPRLCDWAYERSHATYRKEKGIVSRWSVSS